MLADNQLALNAEKWDADLHEDPNSPIWEALDIDLGSLGFSQENSPSSCPKSRMASKPDSIPAPLMRR